MTDDLRERVRAFERLELPGQPQGMHMGTSYLVSDLWQEIERLRAENEALLAALQELVALVRGECPSLLEEDSGGDARLSMKIDDAIDAARSKA